MEVKRNDFLEILNNLKLAISNKGIINQYRCLCFTGEYLIVSNDKIIISYPFETDFKCLVYLEKILKFLEKITSDIFNLTLENEVLVLKSKKNKLEIKTVLADFDIKMDKVKNWNPLPVDFKDGIKMIFLSISEDLNFTHDYINVFHFKENSIISTDNKRIGKYKLDSDLYCGFSLSNYLCDILLKISGITHFSIKKRFLIFKNDKNFTIKCILNNSELPDFEGFLSIPEDAIGIEFNKEICQAFELCNIFNADLHDNDRKVYLNIKKNKLLCYTETDLGKIESEIELSKKYKNEILFIIHPDFLLDLIGKGKFKFYYSEELNRVYYQDDKYNFVTMAIEK